MDWQEYKGRLNGLARQQAGNDPAVAEPFAAVRRRYEIPVGQRHAMLLGRAVDFTFLVTQQINQKLKRDLDLAVKKFEGGWVMSE